MNIGISHENELLQKTVRGFVTDFLIPHEEQADRDGEVPDEIGREIEARSKELGLFAANLPESVGGAGLN